MADKSEFHPAPSTLQFVFLDRDGVLNRKLPEGEFVTRREDLVLLPGAARAVARLNSHGCKVIVITNQRGIGLGLVSEAGLSELHKEMKHDLARDGACIDAIYHCPHDPGSQACTCRKPATGLFDQAMKDFSQARRENSVVIGDSLADIQAGHQLGIYTVYIRGEESNRKPGGEQAAALADAVAETLDEAVERLLEKQWYS